MAAFGFPLNWSTAASRTDPAQGVTANISHCLGRKPALGRGFLSKRTASPTCPVISHGFAAQPGQRRRYVGKTLTPDRTPFTVVACAQGLPGTLLGGGHSSGCRWPLTPWCKPGFAGITRRGLLLFYVRPAESGVSDLQASGKSKRVFGHSRSGSVRNKGRDGARPSGARLNPQGGGASHACR